MGSPLVGADMGLDGKIRDFFNRSLKIVAQHSSALSSTAGRSNLNSSDRSLGGDGPRR